MTPTIVFDLDGTLVDTVPDIAAAYNSAVANVCRHVMSTRDAAALMGDGLATFFERALAASRLALTQAERAHVEQRFLENYRRAPARLSRLYPAMLPLLLELRCLRVNVAVCTNKCEAISTDILKQLGVLHEFDAVVGHRPGAPKKPDPAPLLEAIAKAGGDPGKAILVGDSEADCGAASAAGVASILVSYGYCQVPVRSLWATRCVDTVPELNKTLKQYLAAGALGEPDVIELH